MESEEADNIENDMDDYPASSSKKGKLSIFISVVFIYIYIEKNCEDIFFSFFHFITDTELA